LEEFNNKLFAYDEFDEINKSRSGIRVREGGKTGL
jgi:hypothetical protein